jgi:hypothetical protein
LLLAAPAFAQHSHAGHVHGQTEAVAHQGGGHADHGVETESLFGFVLGSDVEHAGARAIASETVWRSGKRGTYHGVGQKLEFAYGLTDDLSIAGSVLASYHRIRNSPVFDDVDRARLNGLGGEIRWRLIDRRTSGFGLTLHIEPSWSVSDELTGLSGRRWGSENKIIVDTELVPERVFAAFNVINEIERVTEKGEPEIERASKIGVGLALATALSRNVFIGAEARYLRAYEGLTLQTYQGQAFYVGPTLHARFQNNAWLSLAWNVQVSGRERGEPGSFDLTNFERHQVRIKAGFEF